MLVLEWNLDDAKRDWQYQKRAYKYCRNISIVGELRTLRFTNVATSYLRLVK